MRPASVRRTPPGRRGVSNGLTTEAVKAHQRVKRVAHRSRNLHNYGLRLLLDVGLDWTTVSWQSALATWI